MTDILESLFNKDKPCLKQTNKNKRTKKKKNNNNCEERAILYCCVHQTCTHDLRQTKEGKRHAESDVWVTAKRKSNVNTAGVGGSLWATKPGSLSGRSTQCRVT